MSFHGLLGHYQPPAIPGLDRPFSRPPARQSVLVRTAREHTFETFVARMGAWWPVDPFSALGPSLTRVSVVHSGWEKLSDQELTGECALPGRLPETAHSTRAAGR